MAEEDDSTRLFTPTAAAKTSQNQKTQPDTNPLKSMNENKPYLANSENDREREASMEPPRPSDCKVPRGMLDRSLQAQLGRQLRAIFSDVAQEPVPDRFIKLLEALEAREKRR